MNSPAVFVIGLVASIVGIISGTIGVITFLRKDHTEESLADVLLDLLENYAERHIELCVKIIKRRFVNTDELRATTSKINSIYRRIKKMSKRASSICKKYKMKEDENAIVSLVKETEERQTLVTNELSQIHKEGKYE